MRRVIVESPYAANEQDVQRVMSDSGDRHDWIEESDARDIVIHRNLSYLRAAMADCLKRGEAPFASHALYTQPGVLDDSNPDERRLGIDAGFAWRECAQLTVVYDDLGISEGMRAGIRHAVEHGCDIEFRSLKGWR